MKTTRKTGWLVAFPLALSIIALIGVAQAGDCNTYHSSDGYTHYHDGDSSAETCYGQDHSTGKIELFRMYEGDDSVFAANSATNWYDELKGGANFDQLHGQRGIDYIWGKADQDWLYGGYGDDELHGGDGPDRLFGENDSDNAFGGAYGDYFRMGPAGDSAEDQCCGHDNEKDRMCMGTGSDGHAYVEDLDEEDQIWDNESLVVRKDEGDGYYPNSSCPYWMPAP